MDNITINVNVNGTVRLLLDSTFNVDALTSVLAAALKANGLADAITAEPEHLSPEHAETTPQEQADTNDQPEEVAATPLSEDEIAQLRKDVANFIHADESNRKRVKDWLQQHNISRVPNITADLLPDFRKLLGVEE